MQKDVKYEFCKFSNELSRRNNRKKCEFSLKNWSCGHGIRAHLVTQNVSDSNFRKRQSTISRQQRRSQTRLWTTENTHAHTYTPNGHAHQSSEEEIQDATIFFCCWFLVRSGHCCELSARVYVCMDVRVSVGLLFLVHHHIHRPVVCLTLFPSYCSRHHRESKMQMSLRVYKTHKIENSTENIFNHF